MFDRELMHQLATIPAEDRVGWIAERKKLEALAGEMTRLNVEEMIPKYGIARVLRVLAARSAGAAHSPSCRRLRSTSLAWASKPPLEP